MDSDRGIPLGRAAFLGTLAAGIGGIALTSRFSGFVSSAMSGVAGAIPVVRATGGLRDTVRPHLPGTETGTGFVFTPYEPYSLLGACVDAIAAWKRPKEWKRLQARAMAVDVSRGPSARTMLTLYRRLLSDRAPR